MTSAGRAAQRPASPSKVKKTVSLDGELVDQIDGNLSFEVNEALAARVAHQRRQASLAAFLDETFAREGPPDEQQVQTFLRLLGGPAA